MARLKDPAFYLTHQNGSAMQTDIVVPGEGSRRPAFFLWASIAKLQQYARGSGTDLRRHNLMSFETVADVERFVEQHRDTFEYVVINPQLGLRSPIEPFEQLLELARSLAAEDEVAQLKDPAFFIRRADGYPLQTRLPEGVTLPVFSRAEAALDWMDAFGLDQDAYSVYDFRTLDDIRTFVAHYESGYEYITINPVPNPDVSPVLQPFNRLLEIAESAARPLPQPTKTPVAPDRQDQPTIRRVAGEVPVEIQESLDFFQRDHPDPSKTAFIMMEFGDTWAHTAMAEAIKEALKVRGITGVRADDKRYHDHLYFNVQTYMHGCGMGIAVHDRIRAETHNPNVALEVGYLFALRKPVCLLKERTLATLPTDLVGWMYEPFDTLNPSETIPPLVTRWLSDKGF